MPSTQVKSSGGTNLVPSISFELFVIGVLNKYGDVTDVGGDSGVVVHHGDGRLFGAHLQESLDRRAAVSSCWPAPPDCRAHLTPAGRDPGVLHLVLSLQCQDVCDLAKGQAQGDDLGLGGLVRKLPDVKHSRGRSLLHPQLLTVAAIGGPV